MYRVQCSTQETHSTWQHITHCASPNTTLPRHNGGRASTITNGNPALTTLLTKGIQLNKKSHRQYHCHKLQLLPASLRLHPLTNWPLSPKTNKHSVHGIHKIPSRVDQKEDTQPNRKSATYARDSNHRHCCIKLTSSNSAYRTTCKQSAKQTHHTLANH